MDQNSGLKPEATLLWRTSGHICALTDGERHIGHIVRVGGRWHAYDAMHSNGTGDGFLSLGSFIALDCAKDAVEQSYSQLPLPVAGAA